MMIQDRTKILIAEDDVASRRLLEITLLNLGYGVVAAADGTGAWDQLQKPGAPRLAILDVMMPAMDGFELTRKIRAEMKGSYVYVILLTARGFMDDVVHGYEAGADDYVVKPFHSEELAARLKVATRILDLEERIAASRHEQTMREMAATLGHELNNPLASILPSVELLRLDIEEADLKNPEKAQRRLDIIEDSAHRIEKIVENFIRTSKARTDGYIGEHSVPDLSAEPGS